MLPGHHNFFEIPVIKSSILDSCKILSAMLIDKKAHAFVSSLTGGTFICRGFKHRRSSSAATFRSKCSIAVAWLIFKLMTSICAPRICLSACLKYDLPPLGSAGNLMLTTELKT